MAVDRRRELLDVGVSVALRQRLQDLLASVETRTIADAAGVTTGSFFHHFRTRARFAGAVADHFAVLWEGRIAHLQRESESATAAPNAETLRTAASAEWDALMEPSDALRLQHLLWVASAQPLGDDTTRTAADVLREGYQTLDATVIPLYERGLRGLGREMLPPFTIRDLTVVMNAIAEGLRMRAEVDPASVRDDLYADSVTAMLIGITRPRVERREPGLPVELSTLESRLAVGRVRTPPTDAPVETWRQIAEAAAHLFDDRAADEVRVAEVAAAAGVSTSTVYHHFGTVSAVAACGFARHLPELEAIAAVPLTAQDGPIQRIEQVLTRYVELVCEHRGAAEAMVNEIMVECRPGVEGNRPRSIRALLPFPSLVHELIRELRMRGMLRRRVDGERLSRSLIHLVTMRALLFPDETVERIVDETMTLVFDGALVHPSDP